jgi:hypothetical protein
MKSNLLKKDYKVLLFLLNAIIRSSKTAIRDFELKL